MTDGNGIRGGRGRDAKGTVSGHRIERVRVAEALWIKGFKITQIADALEKQFKISRGTAKKDISLAKIRLKSGTLLDTKVDMKVRTGDGLLEIIRSPGAKPTDKLKAWDSYAKLYGLNDAVVLQTVTESIKVEVPDWRTELMAIRDSGNALSANNGGSNKGGNGTKE